MKKKCLLLGLFLFVTLFAITGCKKDKEEKEGLKIVVVETSWSGWNLDEKPEEKKHEYSVKLNKEYVVNGNSLGLAFEITEINDDYVVIKTTEAFSDAEQGIDLGSRKTEFKVYYDKETKLVTPSTDAGSIYYLSLKK